MLWIHPYIYILCVQTDVVMGCGMLPWAKATPIYIVCLTPAKRASLLACECLRILESVLTCEDFCVINFNYTSKFWVCGEFFLQHQLHHHQPLGCPRYTIDLASRTSGVLCPVESPDDFIQGEHFYTWLDAGSFIVVVLCLHLVTPLLRTCFCGHVMMLDVLKWSSVLNLILFA